MKNWRSCLGAVLALTAFSSILPARAENGWVLSQMSQSSPMAGGQTIYITPSGMRSLDSKTGLSMFTKGPAWNVVLFNKQTRKFYQTPLQSWLQSFQRRNLGGKFEGASWRRGRQGSVCNVRAYEFVMDHPPAMKAPARTVHGHTRTMPTIKAASLWVATDIVTPPQVSAIISKIYGIPDCQRIPLRLVITDGSGRNQVAMDTMKVAKTPVPDSVFDIPAGYAQVKSDMEVLLDKESMDGFDDIMKDLDAPPRPKR